MSDHPIDPEPTTVHQPVGPRWVGPALVLGSAVMFSFSGVLTKAIDAGSWTVLAWRGLVGAIGIAAYVRVRGRGRSSREVFRLGSGGWILAVVGGVGSITFIVAFKHTFVANVSVIYATIPFVAALLERLILGALVPRRTLTTAAVTLVGVAIIVSGSLGSANLTGDAVAIAMVVLNALYMVLIRAFPDTDAPLAAAASSLLLFGAGWIASDPLDVETDDVILLLAFGLVFALATVLWTEGTRLIPAAESGLLGSAETPIAIGLAWVLLRETPPLVSLVGAMVVGAAIAVHLRADLRRG
ncbi:MAG: DMT family transporter [Actinomycetota bacterium]